MRTLEELLALEGDDLLTVTPEELALMAGGEDITDPATPPANPQDPLKEDGNNPAPADPPSDPQDPPAESDPETKPKKQKLSTLPPEELAKMVYDGKNQLNTERQRREAAERKAREAEERAKNLNVWDEETHRQTARELAELKAWREEQEAKEQERVARETVERAFVETEEFLDKVAGKPSRPIREINDVFARTSQSLGRDANTADMVAQGIPQGDAERYIAALHADRYRRQHNIGLKAAWVELGFDERFEKPSSTPAPASNKPDPAAIEHTRRAVDATPQLPSGYGSSSSEQLTPEAVQGWIAKNAHRLHELSGDELAVWQRIQKEFTA